MSKNKSISDVRNDMVFDMDNIRAGKLEAKDAAVTDAAFKKSRRSISLPFHLVLLFTSFLSNLV